MSRKVSSETPINSGIMCSSRLKINRHIAIAFGNVAKNLRGRVNCDVKKRRDVFERRRQNAAIFKTVSADRKLMRA